MSIVALLFIIAIYFFQSVAGGSGIFGSIKAQDLSKAAAEIVSAVSSSVASGAAYVDKQVSNIRAVIAKRLLQSKQVNS